ncbi:MAG TPA: tyrosine-type recombinase/integrase [Terriglobales bacterium]|nr:tyrosine-type recombinase/integrase [Terriglobales bacterium]
MIRVQRIIVADGHERSWIVLNGDGQAVVEVNEYLLYLHHLGRSPNTVRAYAHHLRLFHEFLIAHQLGWKQVVLNDLAAFIGWLRRPSAVRLRSDSTINVILAAVGSFYEYQDRLGIETEISRSRRFGAKSPYKPFLHHINRRQTLRQSVMRVPTTKRLPKVLAAADVQRLLEACMHLRDRLLLCLLYESGMRIGQALGLRHADIRSFDGEIEIVPRSNLNGARTKSRNPYVVHVSKDAMTLYADYLVHECREVAHDYVFVNWWGGHVGTPMSYGTVIDLFRTLGTRTGLRVTPHMFRHTHATELLRSGWDAAYVQKRLGHAHIQTTTSIYAHLSGEDMGEAYARYLRERERAR